MIKLSDDGTLDTVLVCDECGAEFRYNFDGVGTEDAESPDDAYDAFVRWAIGDAADDHECPDGRACKWCGNDVGMGDKACPAMDDRFCQPIH